MSHNRDLLPTLDAFALTVSPLSSAMFLGLGVRECDIASPFRAELSTVSARRPVVGLWLNHQVMFRKCLRWGLRNALLNGYKDKKLRRQSLYVLVSVLCVLTFTGCKMYSSYNSSFYISLILNKMSVIVSTMTSFLWNSPWCWPCFQAAQMDLSMFLAVACNKRAFCVQLGFWQGSPEIPLSPFLQFWEYRFRTL